MSVQHTFGGRFIDLHGRRFGLLTVNVYSHKRYTKHFWKCGCDCGGEITSNGEHLRQGRTVSCGCKKIGHARKLGTNNLRHGESSSGGTKRPSAEYRAWKAMKHRCLNPSHKSYARYGGRGIKICNRWASFENFLADMGRKPSPKHSIDRKNNDGNYEPSNCRWATASEQQLNKGHRHTALREVG